MDFLIDYKQPKLEFKHRTIRQNYARLSMKTVGFTLRRGLFQKVNSHSTSIQLVCRRGNLLVRTIKQNPRRISLFDFTGMERERF